MGSTNIRDSSRVRGSVFDLVRLMALSASDCNVLFVSSRTLSLIQTLSREVAFDSRYSREFLPGAEYVIADDSDELDDINEIVNNYELEVQDMSCDLNATLEAMTIAIQNIAAVGCGSCGSELDPVSADPPPIGPGEDFPTIDDYDEYKCEAANWLVDGLEDVFVKLKVYDVDFWATTTLAAGSSLVTAILLTTLIGGAVVVIGGVVIALVSSLIIGSTIDMTDILTVLDDEREALVCALYNGTDAESSRTAFLAELTTAGLNAAEVALLGLILTNELVNNLYVLDEDIEGHTITTACEGCGPDPCDMVIVYGTGTITYDTQNFVITSEPHLGKHEINIQTPYNNGGCGAANWCVEFDSTTITQPEGSLSRQLWCWKAPSTFGNSMFAPNFPALDTPYTVASIQFISATPFTATMRVMDKAPLCTTNPAEGC